MRNVVAKRTSAQTRTVVANPGSVAWKSRCPSKCSRSHHIVSNDLPSGDGKLDLLDAKGIGKSLHTDVAAFLTAERDM